MMLLKRLWIYVTLLAGSLFCQGFYSDSIALHYHCQVYTQNKLQSKTKTLLALRKKILTAIKNKNYTQLASYFHPVEGVKFSPYAFIEDNVILTRKEFLQKIKSNKKMDWGDYDGIGDSIMLSVKEYFKKFVYTADFLHVKKVSINKVNSYGNSLNNIRDIYPTNDFVESYFPGTEKNENMDWGTLTLVFKKYKGAYYLVAIIHDQWTI